MVKNRFPPNHFDNLGGINMALSISQKAGWGLTDMGINVFVIVKQLLVLSFLTQYLEVPVVLAGLATTLVLVFDIITDPIMGNISDRTRSRFGRRIPWILLGSLVMTSALIGLFSVPSDLGVNGNLAWVIGWFLVASIGFTMITIPYGAMAGEMTQDPKERSQMTGFRMAFASVGILIAGAIIPGLAAANGHASAMMSVAPVILIAVFASVFLTRKAPRIDTPSSQSLKSMIGMVFANRAFTVLTAIYGLLTLGIAVITAAVPFAALYLIQDPGDHLLSRNATGLPMESLMFAAFVLGSIVSQAIWVTVSGKLGKSKALTGGLALYIVMLCVVFAALPTGNLWLVFGVFFAVGMTNGAYQQIPWAMYPDLMDVTRARTGESIEGAFSGLWLLGQKTANALGPGILAIILGIYGWQEASGGERVEQVQSALNALEYSATLVPAVFLLFGILALIAVYRPLEKRMLG